MSRRTVVAAATALLLGGGLAAPALADPVAAGGEDFTVCLLAGPDGGREGLCVWVPDPLPR